MGKIIKLIRDTFGQSLIEFAIVLPVLIVLILGMVEYGWILNGKITLTSAAREGARVAIIYEDAQQASDAVISAVNGSVSASSLTGVTAETVFDEPTRTAIVRVKAKIKPIIGLFYNSDVLLTAKAEMRIE